MTMDPMIIFIFSTISAITAIVSTIVVVVVRRSAISQTSLDNTFELQLGRFEKRFKHDLETSFVPMGVYQIQNENHLRTCNGLESRLKTCEDHISALVGNVLRERREDRERRPNATMSGASGD